jgi:hypothetical protein
MILTNIEIGIPDKKSRDFDQNELSIKYPNKALRVRIEVMDRRPLHAFTTWSLLFGKRTKFPSAWTGIPVKAKIIVLILVTKSCNGIVNEA